MEQAAIGLGTPSPMTVPVTAPPGSPGSGETRPPRPAPAAPEHELPERPRLAPGVELAGEMTESAFVTPPWLIDRGGAGYLQVSRLLYRIAELCDGNRDHEQIAAAITEAGEPVQAATIRRLVGGMLVPSGVVLDARGEAATPPARARSPLALAGRMKMLGPGAIDPLTGVLKLLFLPPIVAAVVLAALASRVWLYFINGVAGPAHDTLYHPIDLVVLFALVVFSAGFHEFGHAAALRYGGGRVRGMGVGLYLIYPAVYTDVTENYRLSRWSRVRTDLGGFHFNLVFSLAVLAAALLTHHQFLLTFLLLTDFEILQQSLPFVRFDGYWALADITGIPDFFSHITVFWRRLLRLPQPAGTDIPPLKPWGKAILGAYSLLTIPVLILLLFLTVAALPRILATAWDSGGHQVAAAAHASASGDLLGAAFAGFQIVVLAFPAAAACYMLARTFKQFETRLWRWAGGSGGRRAVAGGATLAVLGVCGFLWAPALPHGGRGPALRNLAPISPTERGTATQLVTAAAQNLAGAVGAAPVPPANAAPEPSAAPAAPATAPTALSSSPAPAASATPVALPSATPAVTSTAVPSPSPTH